MAIHSVTYPEAAGRSETPDQGDIYIRLDSHEPHIVAQVGFARLGLVSLMTGNRYSDTSLFGNARANFRHLPGNRKITIE